MLTKQDAIDQLREQLSPGDTIRPVLRHVSKSGMTRHIDLLYLKDGQLTQISYAAAMAMGEKVNTGNHSGIKAEGCGMDMGFSLIYNLGRTLYPNGVGCSGEGCPSNDHSNGDRDYTPHKSEDERRGADGQLCKCHKDHMHSDGGYAFRCQWI